MPIINGILSAIYFCCLLCLAEPFLRPPWRGPADHHRWTMIRGGVAPSGACGHRSPLSARLCDCRDDYRRCAGSGDGAGSKLGSPLANAWRDSARCCLDGSSPWRLSPRLRWCSGSACEAGAENISNPAPASDHRSAGALVATVVTGTKINRIRLRHAQRNIAVMPQS